MGATHTAYFDVYIENSPKYQLQNTQTTNRIKTQKKW